MSNEEFKPIGEADLLELCPPALKVGFKKAKTLAARADFLYELDKVRLAEQKKVDVIDKFQSKLEAWFIEQIPMNEATGISGKVGCVAVRSKEIATVEDWTKFYAYIKKNNAFELLGKRVNDKAVKERWEQKKAIPGITKFVRKVISLTKAK